MISLTDVQIIDHGEAPPGQPCQQRIPMLKTNCRDPATTTVTVQTHDKLVIRDFHFCDRHDSFVNL